MSRPGRAAGRGRCGFTPPGRHSARSPSEGAEFGGDHPRRLWLRGNGDLPALLVAVDTHDDGAGGLRKCDGGIEDEASAADLGDGVRFAVDV